MMDDLYAESLADIPDDIERVVEGGEEEIQYESGRESGNDNDKSDAGRKENNDGKDEKEKKVRRKQGPRIVLNAERLNGPRGIGSIEQFFSDIKLRGKGKEMEDLELVMKRLEHWTHRLAPRMQFDDCLKKIEKLGSKKEIANRVKRIRLGLDDNDIIKDDEEIETPDSPHAITPDDAFDHLIGSSIPAGLASVEITSEQREQMLRNRLIAEERRAARIKKAQEMKQMFLEKQKLLGSLSQNIPVDSLLSQGNQKDEDMVVVRKTAQPSEKMENDDVVDVEEFNSVTNSQSRLEEDIEFRDEEFETNIAALEREINEAPKEVEAIEKDGGDYSAVKIEKSLEWMNDNVDK